MSKDVRRLFAAQKAAKAASSSSSAGSGSPSPSPSLSSSKRVTHPLAKYDPKTFRLTCAICGPAVPIKSESLWNAHLVSKAHQEAVAKLRAVKEQMQRKEAEAAERLRLQQEQQQQRQAQQTQAQGVKRKAPAGGLVAYADDDESDSEDDSSSEGPAPKQSSVGPESKRIKMQEDDTDQRQAEAEIEEEEDAMAGLPTGFFDSTSSNTAETINMEEPSTNGGQEGDQDEGMDGALPAGFFDDPEEDARIRTEVGGATADLQQRQVDEEFKALQAALAQDLERQEQQDAAMRSAQASGASGQTAAATTSTVQDRVATEHMPYEERVELEEQELEDSIMARSEEEYLLFVEMQERLDALRQKKERLMKPQSSPSPSTAATPVVQSNTKPTKRKNKSILDLVREQEKAKKEKERLAAVEFAKMSTVDETDSKMTSDGDDSEDDEDIEAMMDWRARRV
ncbi:hypothetical protein EDD11_000838 [Mortierella claussenii]|nr:hypothetical protein EDD11_000838 [Mortierella claussenii]